MEMISILDITFFYSKISFKSYFHDYKLIQKIQSLKIHKIENNNFPYFITRYFDFIWFII